MKKFILEKINKYIPYLENNYPIFLENGERLVEFNFDFEEIVNCYINYCELNLPKKKEVPIPDSSLNDRYSESKLLESNNLNIQMSNNLNNQTSSNNLNISNNLQNNQQPSSNNIIATSQTSPNITEKPSGDHESANQQKTGILSSLPKETLGVSKNNEQQNQEFDFNAIPIRKDFSEEDSSNSLINSDDKLFLETVYSKKKPNFEFTIEDMNILDGMMLNDCDLELFLNALKKHEFFKGKFLASEQHFSDEVSLALFYYF